jgi:hypothetical protein
MTTPVQPQRNGKIKISREEYNYLRLQANNILLSGGSQEDVMRFLELEDHQVPLRVPDPQEREVAPVPTYRGLSMRALQGIMFGFGDEAMGSLLGVLTGVGARRGREEYRQELEEWSSRHKKAGFLAEIGGALLTGGLVVKGAAKLGIGAGRAAAAARTGAAAATPAAVRAGTAAVQAAPTVGQRAALGAAQGGLGGAVSGAGHAEGNITNLQGITNRTIGALFGGTLGAALGGVAAPVGRVIGGIARAGVRSVTRGFQGLQRRIPGFGTSDQHARELVRRALAQDNVSVSDAIRAAKDMQRAGTRPTIADLGGESTMRLAAEMRANNTPAKQRLAEMLMGRQADQGERLMQGLFGRIFGANKLGMRNAYHAQDLLQAAQKKAADPLYRAAHREMVQLTAGPTSRMQQFLKRPEFRQAWERGRQTADAEDFAGTGHGLSIPRLKEGPTEAQIATIRGQFTNPQTGEVNEKLAMKLINELREKAEETVLPVRGFDYMKQGLDEVIDELWKKGNMNARKAKAWQTALHGDSKVRGLLDDVDDQIGVYAQARALWRGHAEARDAITLGTEFFGKALF